jgi:hypothetical protein
VEVKATRDNPLPAALRQAEKVASGDLPVVIWRPDGYGPERIGQWIAAMRFSDLVELLRSAGYGDGLPADRKGAVNITYDGSAASLPVPKIMPSTP